MAFGRYYGARRNYGTRTYGAKRTYKRKSKYSALEKEAFKRGQLKKGLSNPQSRVYQSYMNGLKGTTSVEKKPLT